MFALGKNVDGVAPGTGFEVCTNAPACQAGATGTTAGAFLGLEDVAVDRDGNIYTVEDDNTNHRIQKFVPTGAFSSNWGKGVAGGAGYETCATVDGCQAGASGEKGGELAGGAVKLGANPVTGRLLYSAEMDGGRVQAFGAGPPRLRATSPASGSDENHPKVIGDATQGATVSIFDNATCTGTPLATGIAATLASPGIAVVVGDDTTTTFYAKATVGGEASACSAPGLTYVENSTGAGDGIDTRITAAPDGLTTTGTPSFTFAADPAAGATFQCGVDGAAFAPCTSPLTTPSLPDGRHSFQVRAVPPAGSVDTTPATRVFVVDTVAPHTTLTISARTDIGGQRVSGDTYSGYVGIAIDATDPEPGSGVERVSCSVDPPAPATTPEDVHAGACTLALNTLGEHVVYAVSNDRAGNQSAVVSARFIIVPEPDTTITSGPSGVTWDDTPTFTFTFTFTSSIPGSTFRCRVDGGPEVPCTSPSTTPALSGVGGHFIQVAAVSPLGAIDPTPARRDLEIRSAEVHTHTCKNVGWQPDPRRVRYGGCSFEPAGQTCSGLFAKCTSVTPPCPIGAKCTYAVEAAFADSVQTWATR